MQLIIYVALTVGCFSQVLEPCNDPFDVQCLTFSNIMQDLDGNNYNGAWKPMSLTECYNNQYVYQMVNTHTHLYLCHGQQHGEWTITDVICNQTDQHKKAYCDRQRDNIEFCDNADDTWYVQIAAGEYELGGNPPPVRIDTNATKSLCEAVPDGDDGDNEGMSVGWIFIICLMGVLFVYCLMGYMVNGYKNNGEWGDYQRNIPNYGLWEALPKLTIVGCKISYEWVMGMVGKGGDMEETDQLVVENNDEL